MSTREKLHAGRIVASSMIKHFERPDRLPRALMAMAPWGQSVAGLLAGAAARYPERVAVYDDAGSITYREMWRRSQAIASSLIDEGAGPGVGVGLLARNHRGFVEALAAIAATGSDLILLNTGFAGPQLADVVEHEHIDILIHDDEFADIVGDCEVRVAIDEGDLDTMSASGTIQPGADPGSLVILTSGTTGRPKGASRRSDASGVEAVAALLERMPMRVGDTQVIAAPLFHSWGFSHLLLGLSRCTTNVLARRFDPEMTLRATSHLRARVLVVVRLDRGRDRDDRRARGSPGCTQHRRTGGARRPGRDRRSEWHPGRRRRCRADLRRRGHEVRRLHQRHRQGTAR
jgi:fatty-acyl-CoA synthase